MIKSKSTKRSLIISALSMLICLTMLIGTTYAWFTDSVTSNNNIIQSGKLDVELYYQTTSHAADAWDQVKADTQVFSSTFWEPGHLEVVKLKVANKGNLALKYKLGVNVVDETDSVNVFGDPFKLSDYIRFGIDETGNSYDSRDKAIEAVSANSSKLNVSYNSGSIALAPGAEKIVTMVVYMPTSVGNEANHAPDAATPTIFLGLNLYATQVSSESDSFDNTYDANAT